MEWIADLLDMIFITLNATLQTVVGKLSQSPEAFNGTTYAFAQYMNVIFTSVGAGLVVTFFFINLADPAHIADIRRPETILAEFVRLILCEVLVANSSALLERITAIGTSLITTSWSAATSINGGVSSLTLDKTVREVLAESDGGWFNIGFALDRIMLFLLSFILIIAMGFAIIYVSVTAYARFFKIYMYISLAPIPLSTFACRGTSEVGKQFLKSFCGILLQGLILVMAFLLFTVFSENIELDSSDGAIGVVWKYCISILGQLLVLITIIKSSDQLMHKMLGI